MNFWKNPSYQLHDIYRALDVLGNEYDFIQSEVYKNSHLLGKRNDKILYYDCTNYFFEIEQEDGDKKYGKGKEHRPNPIIQMGLFMDGDGIPLALTEILLKEGMLMLTLEGLIAVISLCWTAFGLGYSIGCNHAKK